MLLLCSALGSLGPMAQPPFLPTLQSSTKLPSMLGHMFTEAMLDQLLPLFLLRLFLARLARISLFLTPIASLPFLVNKLLQASVRCPRTRQVLVA